MKEERSESGKRKTAEEDDDLPEGVSRGKEPPATFPDFYIQKKECEERDDGDYFTHILGHCLSVFVLCIHHRTK